MRPPQSVPLPPPKILVTVALDEDVLAFLRRVSEPSNFNQVVNHMASLPSEGPTI